MGNNGLDRAEKSVTLLEEHYSSAEKHPEKSLFMLFCGIERCMPGHGYRYDERDFYLVHCVLEGNGTLEYRGRKYHLGKGQSFLIYPDENAYYQADFSSPWKYCWVALQGKHAGEIMEEVGYSRDFPICDFHDPNEIERHLKEIISNRGEEWNHTLRRESAFLSLTAELLRQGGGKSAYAGRKQENNALELGARAYTKEAIRYLETHFRERIRIQDLAHEIGISRSYLTQQVKEEIGVSPRALLINIRMEHAVSYLENSNDPIQLVALECGYDDALAFSKAFRGRYGMSPTEYRKMKRAASEAGRGRTEKT